jgi:uncharacterized delta-60 repeat protein
LARYHWRPRSVSALILIVLAAAVTLAAASSASALSKGQLDSSFGSGGIASVSSGTELLGTAVQSDGKVVAVGASGVGTPTLHLLVARFTTSGRLDSTFSGGQVTGPANVLGQAVAIQSDGKIVVTGTTTDSTGVSTLGVVVMRLNSNGSRDGRFGSGGVVTTLTRASHGQGNAIAVAPSGEIIVAGDGAITSGPNQFFPGVALVRVSTTGHLDSSTVFDLGKYSIATGVAVQSNGKIVVGGTQRGDLQTTQTLAARFNSNGTRDTSFAHGLFVHQYAVDAAYSGFNAVALQPDGKVVLAGTALNGGTGINTLVVRLTSGGGLDSSFGSGGAVNISAANNALSASAQNEPYGALGVVVAAGEIFTAGWYDSFHLKQLALWGLTSTGRLDPGFGSGGQTLVPGSGTNSLQGNAIAIGPTGNLDVAATSIPLLGSGAQGLVAQFGGPPLPPPRHTISNLRVTSSTFRAAKRGGSIGSTGMRISYTSSIAGKTVFTVLQPLPGVKSGKRCVAPPKKRRRGQKSCTRTLTLGSFTHNDTTGSNAFRFTGRVGDRTLAPGRYTLKIVPATLGNVKQTFLVRFTIIR